MPAIERAALPHIIDLAAQLSKDDLISGLGVRALHFREPERLGAGRPVARIVARRPTSEVHRSGHSGLLELVGLAGSPRPIGNRPPCGEAKATRGRLATGRRPPACPTSSVMGLFSQRLL